MEDVAKPNQTVVRIYAVVLLGFGGPTILAMEPGDEQPVQLRPNDSFATTRWSVVLAAGRRSSPKASAALEELCGGYWYPLYVYVRRRGFGPNDAADLTQAFFAQLLEKNRLEHVEPGKGRFRSFLIASMKHFLANEWHKSRTQRRGGGRVPISIDFATADTAYRLEPMDEMTAERAFERRWALTVLDRVLGQLRAEYIANGRGDAFDRIKETITYRDVAGRHREIAADLAMTEGAVKVAVHRMRRRYRELLMQEVSQTVSAAGEIDNEVNELFNALSQQHTR